MGQCSVNRPHKYPLALYWITASYITFSLKMHSGTPNHAHVVNDLVQHEFQTT